MKNYYLLSLQSIKTNLFFGHKITQILQNFQISIVFFCIKIVFFTKQKRERASLLVLYLLKKLNYSKKLPPCLTALIGYMNLNLKVMTANAVVLTKCLTDRKGTHFPQPDQI